MSEPSGERISAYCEFTNSVVEGERRYVEEALAIGQQLQAEQDAWVAGLREQGVKAAHPDDGWVDRERNSVQLVYPAFNDGPEVGDLIALGTPRGHRLVRVTGFRPLGPLAIPPDPRGHIDFEVAAQVRPTDPGVPHG